MTQLNRHAVSLLRPRVPSNDNDGDYSGTTRFKKPDEREKSLRSYLDQLKEDAGQCSKATNTILKCHTQFANLMAQRMDDMSKSRTKVLNFDDSETTRLTNDISEASRVLSRLVSNMKDNLHSFVSALEKIELTARKKKRKWILTLLKSLFDFLARIIVALGPVVINAVAPGLSGFVPVDSLWTVVSTTFGEASGAFLEHTISCKEEEINSRRRI
jgi:hypothetical protein